MTLRQGEFVVCSFYEFFSLDQEAIARLQQQLTALAARLSIGGLLIVAREGINGTFAGSGAATEEFKRALSAWHPSRRFGFKISQANSNPFRRFRIKVRDEIVTTRAEKPPVPQSAGYLTPRDWQEELERGGDFVLLDTRNWYETRIGAFRGAVLPELRNFQEFADYIERSGPGKDKKVLMYCTGGIRCEKAREIMLERGYQQVYQLQGGILKYLEEFPNRQFEGECFVFDGRVAVDQSLAPTRTYAFCPHCGQPGKEEISCRCCGAAAKVCTDCREFEFKDTCSKNCANRLARLSASAG